MSRQHDTRGPNNSNNNNNNNALTNNNNNNNNNGGGGLDGSKGFGSNNQPTTVGSHFRVGKKIGEGSFGIIYEGIKSN